MLSQRFMNDAAWSRSERQSTDLDTIRSMIPGCQRLRVASISEDRSGIDYIATLRGGAEVNIDAKNRRAGCSSFWLTGDPEVALETWSVMPGSSIPARAGWTLDESKKTDLVLFQWDPSDTTEVLLVSFQLLRVAARRFLKTSANLPGRSKNGMFGLPAAASVQLGWADVYRPWRQDNGRYTSECIFVPVPVVLDAIATIQRGRRGA